MGFSTIAIVALLTIAVAILALQLVTRLLHWRQKREDKKFSARFLALNCPRCKVPFGPAADWIRWVRDSDVRWLNFGRMVVMHNDKQPSGKCISITCPKCLQWFEYDSEGRCLYPIETLTQRSEQNSTI
jgi:hypothetical protein